jgi:hypothetical protein
MTEQTPSQLKASRLVAQALATEAIKTQIIGGAAKMIFADGKLKRIDGWIAASDDPAMDRNEAVRRLIELGLKAKK